MVPAKRVKPSDEETVEPDLFEDPLGLIYAEHYRCRVVCNTLDETPRGLVENRLDELKELVAELTACDHDHESVPPEWKGRV